jgi:hypothetical protein
MIRSAMRDKKWILETYAGMKSRARAAFRGYETIRNPP